MSPRVKAAMTPDPDAHLAEKRRQLAEDRVPQIWLLVDEVEARAIVAWRQGPGALRRQARATLTWFAEVAHERTD